MSDNEAWSHNAVGAYRVTRRYRGTGEDVGRVYEAYNGSTGAPAVLVAPGHAEDWQPQAGWQLRATAGEAPAHLALEVLRAPAGAAVPELTLLLHRLASAASRLEGRPDVAAHLSGVGARARRWHAAKRVRRPVWAALAAACLAALVAHLPDVAPGTWRDVERGPSPDVMATGVAEGAAELPADGAMELHANTLAWGEKPGRGLPAKPLKGQKRAPCTPRSQVELNGVCWISMEAKPPCPEDVFEAGGRCLVPVYVAPSEPASILP